MPCRLSDASLRSTGPSAGHRLPWPRQLSHGVHPTKPFAACVSFRGFSSRNCSVLSTDNKHRVSLIRRPVCLRGGYILYTFAPVSPCPTHFHPRLHRPRRGWAGQEDCRVLASTGRFRDAYVCMCCSLVPMRVLSSWVRLLRSHTFFEILSKLAFPLPLVPARHQPLRLSRFESFGFRMNSSRITYDPRPAAVAELPCLRGIDNAEAVKRFSCDQRGWNLLHAEGQCARVSYSVHYYAQGTQAAVSKKVPASSAIGR